MVFRRSDQVVKRRLPFSMVLRWVASPGVREMIRMTRAVPVM